MTSRASALVAIVTGVYLAGASGCNTDPAISGVMPGAGGAGQRGGSPGGGATAGATGAAGQGGGGSPGGAVRDAGFAPPPRLEAGAGGTGGSAPGAGAPACAATTAKAEPVPVDIHIMLDRSGSMSGPKWDAAKMALTSFVRAPTTVGLNVGIAVFPLPSSGVGGLFGGSSCSIADYARPLVPVTALPAAATRVIDVLNMTNPFGGTPTSPALTGAIQYARQWEMMMGRRIVVALVTDGIPNDCQSSVASVSMIAQQAAATGILTFVVGVGPMLQSLNAIAVAGGTQMAYLVDGGSADQLIDALKKIQTQASKLACSFMIPPPKPGEALDPTKVNVRFSATGNPAAAMTLPQVMSRGQCGMTGGWYYDNPAMPTTINLCDASCQLANSSPMGELSLQFGCKTEVIP